MINVNYRKYLNCGLRDTFRFIGELHTKKIRIYGGAVKFYEDSEGNHIEMTAPI